MLISNCFAKVPQPAPFFSHTKARFVPGGAFCTLILVFLSLYNSKLRVQKRGGAYIGIKSNTAELGSPLNIGSPLVPVFKMVSDDQFEAN